MRFDQVKMLVRDAASLSAFYRDALGCELLGPPTTFDDEVLARGIGAPGRTLRMAWLRLPGGSDDGPILELYEIVDGPGDDWPYEPGQGHIAFEVDDVAAMADRIVVAGGSLLGEVVDWEAPSGNLARFVFLRDPEGNMVDVWQRLEP